MKIHFKSASANHISMIIPSFFVITFYLLIKFAIFARQYTSNYFLYQISLTFI
jgi:hypothetical protein